MLSKSKQCIKETSTLNEYSIMDLRVETPLRLFWAIIKVEEYENKGYQSSQCFVDKIISSIKY